MTSALGGWTPIRLEWDGDTPVAVLCFTEGFEFSDPFFEQTVERCFSNRPFSLVFQRKVALDTIDDSHASDPDGFIFHASRCGSTVITQMLAVLPDTRVISEAGPIDSIFRARFRGMTVERRVDRLRRIVRALGPVAPARYFVKLDSWNTIDLPLARRAFPGVPWIFVYREPLEVLVSQDRQRGVHMIPGMLQPELFGLDLRTVAEVSPEEYMARVLGAVMEAARGAAHDRDGLLVEYRQLPGIVLDDVARHFRLDLSGSQRSAMRDVAKWNVKNSQLPFNADAEAKRGEATIGMRRAVDERVQPLYEALESARKARTSGERE